MNYKNNLLNDKLNLYSLFIIMILTFCSFTVAAISSYFALSSLGKSTETKIHLSLLFGISLTSYICIITITNQEYFKIANAFLLFSILPFFYVYSLSWKEISLIIFFHLLLIGSIICLGLYNNN